MKKLILTLTILTSMFLMSCEKEPIEQQPVSNCKCYKIESSYYDKYNHKTVYILNETRQFCGTETERTSYLNKLETEMKKTNGYLYKFKLKITDDVNCN
jgi:hypothetical protein